MSFTDEEMAVLAQLVYHTDMKANPNGGGPTLEEVLDVHSEILKNNLGEGYEHIIDNLYEKVKGKEYNLIQTINHSESGLQAIAIEMPNKEVVVCCRGTEPNRELMQDVFYI